MRLLLFCNFLCAKIVTHGNECGSAKHSGRPPHRRGGQVARWSREEGPAAWWWMAVAMPTAVKVLTTCTLLFCCPSPGLRRLFISRIHACPAVCASEFDNLSVYLSVCLLVCPGLAPKLPDESPPNLAWTLWRSSIFFWMTPQGGYAFF